MEHIRIVPDIDSDPDIEAAGWAGARVHELLLKVSAMKDLRGRITPQYQNRAWLAKRWNLGADDLPGVLPEDFISNGVARLLKVGLLADDGGGWVIRGWDKFYSKPKTGKERTQDWRDRGSERDGGDAGDVCDARDVCDATPPHPPTPPTPLHPPTSQRPPPPTPSAETGAPAPEVEEVKDFLSCWEEHAQRPPSPLPPTAVLAKWLQEQRQAYGEDFRPIVAGALKRFHRDKSINSHKLKTWLNPKVYRERMAEAAAQLSAPEARRL